MRCVTCMLQFFSVSILLQFDLCFVVIRFYNIDSGTFKRITMHIQKAYNCLLEGHGCDTCAGHRGNNDVWYTSLGRMMFVVVKSFFFKIVHFSLLETKLPRSI